MFDPELWLSVTFENTPIYFRKDKADWFVPNTLGDRLLGSLTDHERPTDIGSQQFLERLPQTPAFEYQGRRRYLKDTQLRELWFHITNRCNLSCSHCLFASGPDDAAEMQADQILELAAEAVSMGCKLFALTGGEPFIHRNIEGIINGLLQHEDGHVAVLTNGMNIKKVLEKNTHWDFDRMHLQISVDGLENNHDRIRGMGAYKGLTRNLKWLKSENIPYTLSMCVDNQNLGDMTGIIDIAREMGASNVHYMWYFVRGRGKAELFAKPDKIFEQLKKARLKADTYGLSIDNIEGLKTQIFAPSGTIHDGTTAGWESAAIGPDGNLYPSAALVGYEALSTPLEKGLRRSWENSLVLDQIRHTTILDTTHPLRFFLGGGDMDHSFAHKKSFMGDDPYMALYEKLALYLIQQEAKKQKDTQRPQLKLKMGDILESCGAHGTVALVHSNCLLAVAEKNSLSVVKDFYHQAAVNTKEDIINPVCYDDDVISHIPEAFRFRGYGCGSPVADADIKEGETIVDLGSGSGVECFIAAKITGKTGRVYGVDMLDAMLEKANAGLDGVAKNLGYNNIAFKKGYLEALPLEDNTADVILSNCVMNLSVNKRMAYGEIYRVLKPGGRLVISDVVCDTDPDPAIRNDEILRGECIAGAMTQKDLMGILNETGFDTIGLIKRFPYREVMGHPFYSLTYTARKPQPSNTVCVMYRGPMAAMITSTGNILFPGHLYDMPQAEATLLGDQVFIFDDTGNVTNIEMEAPCCCAQPPEASGVLFQDGIFPTANNDTKEKPNGTGQGQSSISPAPALQVIQAAPMRHAANCMKCGAPLEYLKEEKQMTCVFCGRTLLANARCENGHFVCDTCHSMEALGVVEHICLHTTKTDMVALLTEIRSHPAVPVNGPEHHYMVPAIILSTYKNLGGDVTPDMIQAGIQRGRQVSGGYCGFMGVCGAAIGVGTAFSLILEANPIKPLERRQVQTVTQKVLAEISKLEAARCCQRDSWIALTEAARLSDHYLPIKLKADKKLVCRQQAKNKECIKDACPLWPAHIKKA